ncbi:MAG TPA: hypothetical protein VGR73_06295 [Bryobacteraceae bacterium]|nr:hypothetical protein [Bryobacteraceae bacterium]
MATGRIYPPRVFNHHALRAGIYALRVAGAVCLAVSLASTLLADPGFGTVRKKKLDLQIRQPAAVRLSNVSFAVTGTTAEKGFLPAVESLVPTLETELLSNEKSLVKKPPAEADYTIALRVTSFSIGVPQQRVVGSLTFVRWTGALHVAYQTLNRGGRAFDAGNVTYNYDKESESNPKANPFNKIPFPGRKKAKDNAAPQSAEDMKQILVDEVAEQVAAKLGNTRQAIQVQVAAGEDHLNRAAEFMDKQLWSRALDELEKMTPLVKEESEAYRQYDLGLVYEAMSYEAPLLKDQKANLLQATEYYDKALEMNRKEKYFVETVARSKDALARYKAFEGMAVDDAKRPKAPEPPKESPKQELAQQSPAPAKQQSALTQAQPAPAKQQPTPVKQTVQAKPQPVNVAQATPPAAPKQTAPVAQKQPAPVVASATPRPQTAPPAAAVPVAKQAPTSLRPAPPAAQKAQAKILKVGDVIEMFTSNVPEDQIAAIIRGSAMQFDPLDKDTAIAIARAKLPISLQNEMRAKVGAPLLTPVKK